MIRPGEAIAFKLGRRRAVHARCDAVGHRAAARSEAPRLDEGCAIPHGKKESSMQTYQRQWDTYVSFVTRRGYRAVPGRDVAWDLPLLWLFMLFRLRSCKPATIISEMSALAHFGAHFGYLRATSKHDGDSVMYRRVCNMRSQLTIDYRLSKPLQDRPEAPEQTCPLGVRAVEMILSALGIFSFRSFAAQSRYTRHHVVACVLQHAAAMRFGHFPARMYTVAMFRWSARHKAFILVTDWHRYSGVHRYTIYFRLHSRFTSTQYTVRRPGGGVLASLCPASVLFWHFSLLRKAGETVVFAPLVPGTAPVRAARQRWLRAVLLAAIPTHESAARRMVFAVTPHAFRPGLAGDLLAEGVPFDVIMRVCRWWSERVARMYAERPSLCSFLSSAGFCRVRQVGADYVAMDGE